MKAIQLLILLSISFNLCAQQNFYDVNSGNGNGLRFWSSELYKIHMGNSSEYKYGPVTDFSIKTNMSPNANRGWTWGVAGQDPIAAISNIGDMQIAGNFVSAGITINATTINSPEGIVLSQGNDITPGEGSNNRNSGRLFFENLGETSNSFAILKKNDHLSFRGNAKAGITTGTEYMVMTNSGSVGIGTSDPQNKLSVNGTIWAKKVKVALTDAADWVFEDEYELKSLKEVEAHIKKHKHLPDMPSAEDFRNNDMDVAEMNNKLLQKIEELTLYLIEQDKRLEVLERENANLKKAQVIDR